MNRQLSSLLESISSTQCLGADVHSQSIQDITIDSRKASTGVLFAALQGTQVDGHDFIPKAIEQGCTAILCSTSPKEINPKCCYILCADVRETLGKICKEFHNNVIDDLIIVGTTGTNGKTSVSTLLFDYFTQQGYQCGLVSTVEYRIGKTVLPSTHTTPDIVGLHQLMAEMAKAGCTHCFMEVSSHAAHQNRIASIPFTLGIFTNITRDHLDYHGTFDNYLKAKKSFFDNLPASAMAITNKDDKNGMVMIQNTKAIRYTYAMKQSADFTVRVLEHDFNGMQLQLNKQALWTPLIGEFNAYNLCAVFAAVFLLTQGDEEAAVKMSALGTVNGRFQVLQGPNRITAIIDYAHTPDALENVIGTINQIRKNSAQLITVVGCGGNRDQGKRPQMGKIAASLSSKVIFTSDNPRNESPESIIAQMQEGVEPQHFKRTLKITDRKEAIRTACMLAQPGDVILIAGKGHETYQEIQGVKHPFDDKQITQESFNLIA